jgi:hypothetical protein
MWRIHADGITNSCEQTTRGSLPVLGFDWGQVLNPHSNKRSNFDILKNVALRRGRYSIGDVEGRIILKWIWSGAERVASDEWQC